MTSIIDYKAAREIADAFDKKLRVDNRFLRGAVLLVHHDGSIFVWNAAFARMWGEFFLIFTEHHESHVYHREDVLRLVQYKMISGAVKSFDSDDLLAAQGP